MKHKLILAVMTVMLLASGLIATVAQAEEAAQITFEPPTYTVGSIHNQDGWVKLNESFDVVVASQSTYPSFGAQSLRISNAVTSGTFGDQAYSKPLANEAGETESTNNGQSGGERQPRFEAQWEFASVTGVEQPGLRITARPSRGDNGNMSYVSMADTPSGLEVTFYDVQYANPGPGVANFVPTTVVSGLDRTVPHTIRLEMEFIDGPSNDIVTVTVDDTYTHTGTSWEDYFRWDPEAQAEQSPRTVDSILFRLSGTAAPSTNGYGFYIDNMLLSSGGYTIDDVRGATEELVTNPRAEQALLATLDRAEMFLENGKPFLAYLTMIKFITQVDRFERTGAISGPIAAELAEQAGKFIRSMF